MGFANSSYINIWEFTTNESGKSGNIKISISKKMPDGTYKTEYRNNFVRVAGTAFEQMKGKEVDKDKGLRARIIKSDVTGGVWNENRKEFTKYQFVIFALAFEGEEGFEFERKSAGQNKSAARTAAPAKRKPAPKKEVVEEEDDYDF